MSSPPPTAGSLLPKAVAETIGTFVLVPFGCTAVTMGQQLENGLGVEAARLVFGLVVMVVTYATGHISGAHINPAVTVAFAALGRFRWAQVPMDVGAQFVRAPTAADPAPGDAAMSTRPRAILFLCVANSARSQMAEGLARSLAPGDIAIYSAGSAPATVHPLAKQVMAEIGIDLDTHSSKGVTDIPQDEIDLAITLCAEEVCPVFPHDVRKLHWPHPDPAEHGTEGEVALASFRGVRDQIRERLAALFADIEASRD